MPRSQLLCCGRWFECCLYELVLCVSVLAMSVFCVCCSLCECWCYVYSSLSVGMCCSVT